MRHLEHDCERADNTRSSQTPHGLAALIMGSSGRGTVDSGKNFRCQF